MARLSSELILSLVDRVSAPARGVQSAIRGINDQIARNQAAIRRTQGQLGAVTLAGAVVAGALRAPVIAAMNLQSAMTDIDKVVGFRDTAELDAFRQKLIDLSKEIPLPIQQLAELAVAGGNAGLRAADLERFVEMAAQIQVAFGISAQAAGEFVTAMQASLGLTLNETMLLSDGINELSNNVAASAEDVAKFMVGVAAQAESFGFAAEEAAAYGAAMIAAGVAPEVAATSFKNMGRALTRGASATNRQRQALSDLGLEASDVAKRMQDDAKATTIDVMARIAALPKEVQAAAMSNLFGDEASALAPLLNNMELLKQTLGLVADEATYAGSAFREYANRSKTFESDLIRFQNVVAELSVSIGEALLPALTDGMTAMKPWIETISKWVRENSALVSTVVKVTASLIGLRVGLLTLKLAGLYGKGGALWALSQGMGMVGRASGGLIGAARSQMALSAALAAMDGSKVTTISKIGAALRGLAGVTRLSVVAGALGSVATVMAGISAPVWATIAAAAAAIGAAGFAIWKNWDRIAAIMRGVGSAMWEAHPAIVAVRSALDRFSFIGRAAGDALGWMKTKASDLWSYITTFFGPGFFSRNILSDNESADIEARARALTVKIVSAMSGLPGELLTLGSDAIASLYDGMRTRLAQLLEWVRGIPGMIADAIGGINLSGLVMGGAPGQLAISNRDGADRFGINGTRAYGGAVAAGKSYLVGERGPELITPSRAAFVNTTNQLRSLSYTAGRSGSAGGGPTTNNIGPIHITNPPGASADELSREFGRQTGALMRSHYSDAF